MAGAGPGAAGDPGRGRGACAIMLKWSVTVKRRDGVDRQAMLDHWQQKHAPNVVAIMRPERYRLTIFDPDADGGTGFDGMASIWFRDRDHFQRCIGPDVPLARETDGFGEFSDYDDGFGLLTTERVAVDGEVGPSDTKFVSFVRRHESVSQEALFRDWTEIHIPNSAAAVARTPDAVRYVASLADPTGDGLYDGMSEVWFRQADLSLEDLQGRAADGFSALQSHVTLRGREIAIVG